MRTSFERAAKAVARVIAKERFLERDAITTGNKDKAMAHMWAADDFRLALEAITETSVISDLITWDFDGQTRVHVYPRGKHAGAWDYSFTRNEAGL